MHGVLLIDKPAGLTSSEVVRRVKKHARADRVGHLGTLDPFATGLLPIMIGEATKLAPFIDGGDREYEGLIRLGAETDTLDPEGEVIRVADIPALDPALLREVAQRFTGALEQTPPVYSAIKRGGVPLYRLARKGRDVDPPASRRIDVRRFELAIEAPDTLRFALVCSAGTYARALARDIGVALGSAGYLVALRRLRSGAFSLSDAIALDDALAAFDSDPTRLMLLGLREAVRAMPEVTLDPAREKRLRNGDSGVLERTSPANASMFKVISEGGALIAIARATSPITAEIVRVFVT